MLQSIEIENFRCFHRSRLENFGQVNLIGGMNNAGKTALLEAILLVNEPTWESVAFLQQLRSENSAVFEERPELAWGGFFLNQDKSAVIKLRGGYDKEQQVLVEITCEEKPKFATNGNGQKQDNGELVRVMDSATMAEVGISALTISLASSDWRYKTKIAYEWADAFHQYKPVPLISSDKPKSPHPAAPEQKTYLVPTGFKKPAPALAREFEKAKLRDDTAPILEALRIVDDSIAKIESINLGEPRIYVFRKDEKPQSLNFFGDALNKIADLMLRISNNPNCILLIDEIENGIHHSNQEAFWKRLIQISLEKNVQIFATSHSDEMIEAFQSAAVADQQEDKVRYIEMFRSARTGEIVGQPIDMETLDYDIQNSNTYRGE